MKIALTGNPNSGKTSLFNIITGANEKVGNWAGVTVDKKERHVKRRYCSAKELIAVDLPGAYSMSPFTSEESITSSYIKEQAPDVIINIVDATNLARSLFFTTQILELGIPTVVALNKSDINKKKHTVIDTVKLSEILRCPVINTSSVTGEGIKKLLKTTIANAQTLQTAPYSDSGTNLEDPESVKAADRKRFEFVNAMVSKVEHREVLSNKKTAADKIDELLTNKWIGIPVFAAVMWLVFQISQVWVGPYVADFLSGILGDFQSMVGGFFENANPILSALLVDGVIGGAVAVIGFLPLVMVMYFLITLLEDCGYMSRVAALFDPIFKRVGLSGKSVIPFVMSVGCAVPGVMASRTVKNERERRATAMLAPFMPCGAKIPVISLFAGAFFENAGWVSTAMYLSGIVIIFLGALIINKITGYKTKKSFFIIEIPEYKLPSIVGAFKAMCARGKEYIIKAATIILLCNTAVHIMQTFDISFAVSQSADTSILAFIAKPFAVLLIPVVGVMSWQLAAAAVTGFIAKENVVGTLAVCFVGLESLLNSQGSAAEISGVIGLTKAAALAYLMFNLFSPPCFAAIGAMNAEMKSAKWTIGGIALQLAVGFTVGFGVYQIGTLITEGTLGAAFVPGLIAVIAMAAFITALCISSERKLKAEYALKAKKKESPVK